MVEWYTRATQNRMAQALRVQVPPPAQFEGRYEQAQSDSHCRTNGLRKD